MHQTSSIQVILKLCGIGILFLTACKKPLSLSAPITAMGHGGMGWHSVYPVNSLESLLQCAAVGADGTDIDLQITKDSVLVLFHNTNLDQSTSLKGAICDKTWSELQHGYYTGNVYAGYRIITLKDALRALPQQQFTLSLDCKFKNDNPDFEYLRCFARQLFACCNEYPQLNSCFVESVNPYFLNYLHELDSTFKRVLYARDFELGLKTAIAYQYYGISMSNQEISKEEVKTAQNTGLYVMLWNVSSFADQRKAIDKWPNCIQSDRIEYLLKQLN